MFLLVHPRYHLTAGWPNKNVPNLALRTRFSKDFYSSKHNWDIIAWATLPEAIVQISCADVSDGFPRFGCILPTQRQRLGWTPPGWMTPNKGRESPHVIFGVTWGEMKTYLMPILTDNEGHERTRLAPKFLAYAPSAVIITIIHYQLVGMCQLQWAAGDEAWSGISFLPCRKDWWHDPDERSCLAVRDVFSARVNDFSPDMGSQAIG
jgi:hypothetical protein